MPAAAGVNTWASLHQVLISAHAVPRHARPLAPPTMGGAAGRDGTFHTSKCHTGIPCKKRHHAYAGIETSATFGSEKTCGASGPVDVDQQGSILSTR
eukprot:365537-Chlamydomonas_euryale.AAC.7